MLVRLSIANFSGNEVGAYQVSEMAKLGLDMDLVSNFLQAMQLFSEGIGTSIKEMVFSSIFLYIKTFGDFSIRILLDEKASVEIEPIFDALGKQMFEYMTQHSSLMTIDQATMEELFVPLLKPLLSNSTEEVVESDEQEPPRKSFGKSKLNIALVGLERAGKTSIKKAFFEKWSKDMIQKIRPTLGVELLQKEVDFIGKQFKVMDFGGQPTFRKMYLASTMKWRGLDVLVFLIDIQKPETFESSVEYLTKVWELVKKANPTPPRLAIFLHKVDPTNRLELTPSLGKCLILLKDFMRFATIYTTSIEDTSVISSLIKTLSFCSPEIIIKKLFDELLLLDFETKIQERFNIPDFDWNEDNGDVKSKLGRVKWRTLQMGKEFGYTLQEIWFKFFMGDWSPKSQQLKWNILEIEKTQNDLFIRIRNWVDPASTTKALILTIFDGILEGFAITLNMPKPRRIQEDGFFGVWKLIF